MIIKFGLESGSWNQSGPYAVVRSRNDLDDRFDFFDRVQGFELEFSDELGEDRLLLHQRELLADAVSGAGGKWDVGKRVTGFGLSEQFRISI